DSSEEDSEDESEEKPSKTPQKRGRDVEMVDAALSEKKAPKTPVTPREESGTSKTLFVGNLPFSVERADVEGFFKDAGEVVDVRFATDDTGKFKGFGHVEFATAAAAQKALGLNGQQLFNRELRIDLARERGAYTPNSSNWNNSSQKSGRGQSQTVFVRGFDTSLGEDEIRGSLQEHFGSCGDITRVSIPKDYESGAVKGFAYVDFSDVDSMGKALEL
ncbi:hypothetical protein L3H39_11005, partial [Corynebacterium sp. MC-16]|nr:hypothetical protein [Corynebacterium parakroppenstedtii]